MLTSKNIAYLHTIYHLLPKVKEKPATANVCNNCFYLNESNYEFCTNCGYPLKDAGLIQLFKEKQEQRNRFLYKAKSAVSLARVVLFMIASFLSLGIFFAFSNIAFKYFIVTLAALFSGLFFFLASLSHKKPFTALLTSFIVLVVFSALNVLNKLQQPVSTIQGIIGMFVGIALLIIVLKGVQGAYRINLIQEELQLKKND